MQACIHIYLNCRVLTVSETSNFASCSWFSSKDNSCCGKYASAGFMAFHALKFFSICLFILVVTCFMQVLAFPPMYRLE